MPTEQNKSSLSYKHLSRGLVFAAAAAVVVVAPVVAMSLVTVNPAPAASFAQAMVTQAVSAHAQAQAYQITSNYSWWAAAGLIASDKSYVAADTLIKSVSDKASQAAKEAKQGLNTLSSYLTVSQ